jgi:hypothetical protein
LCLWEDFFLDAQTQTNHLLESFEVVVDDLLRNVEAEQEQKMAEKYAGVPKASPEPPEECVDAASSELAHNHNTLLYTLRLMKNMCVRCEKNQVCCACHEATPPFVLLCFRAFFRLVAHSFPSLSIGKPAGTFSRIWIYS